MCAREEKKSDSFGQDRKIKIRKRGRKKEEKEGRIQCKKNAGKMKLGKNKGESWGKEITCRKKKRVNEGRRKKKRKKVRVKHDKFRWKEGDKKN